MPPAKPCPAGRDDFQHLVAAVVAAVRALGPGAAGYTTEDVAAILRVSPDKVRAWIASGELVATNTAVTLVGKPRWIISQQALDAFRTTRTSAPLPKPVKRRRPSGEKDFFPGD